MSPRILPDARQVAAADPGQSVFVTANAGSGKTSTLVDRVARLLLAGVEPGEILCVTYTKAAAAEMQGRLFDRLGAWAVMDNDQLSRSLADLDGRDPAALADTDLSDARKLFAKALDTPGGLKIQTIHAFCEKLLRRFPIEAGVSPSFAVLENQAALALSHGAREDLARQALRDPEGRLGRAYSHFAVELDWNAFQALLGMIEGDRSKLAAYTEAVLAGAAPSPHALTGADPDQGVADIELDFIRWIDRDEWRRMADLMGAGSVNDQKCAERMRAAAWSFAGLGDVFLTEGAARKNMTTARAPAAASDFLASLQRKYLAALAAVRKARVAEDTVHVLTLAGAHAAFYDQAKIRRGALDFGDLVARAVALLTERASAAWVLYKLDGGIEHILIDEAQDTAPDQWNILKALSESFFAGEGTPRPGPQRPARTVFAVGDEKQSIYSFQGARPERLRQETQSYEARVRGAQGRFSALSLETSFRSTPQVLAFVDAAFADPDRARALTGEQGDLTTHTPNRLEDQGAVDLWPLFQGVKPPEADPWDPVDQEPATSGRKHLAAALALEIRRQVLSGTAVYDRKAKALRPCGYGDFLILVRRRDATFEEIIRALKTAGVPVAGADRLKLSSHIVFDDLIALARVALFPDDDLSLACVLRGPFCDIDEDGLFDLAGADPKRGGLWRELRDRAAERPEWTRAWALIDHALTMRGRDPFAFFSGLLNRIDETGRSGRARILHRLGREAEEAIDETLAQVLAAEDRGGIDLETCVALLESADVEVKREMEGARNEVRVMTVHGAKGLEAPVVILPDTTSRAKAQGPSLMPVETGTGVEAWLMCPGSAKEDCPASADARAARQARTDDETLRLLYVALTRARDRIIVMGRACGNSKAGFEDGSWWSVLTETFARLGQSARDIGDGRLRFGADPAVRLANPGGSVPPVVPPAWASDRAPSDPAVRLVAPSQMQGGRISAPSPLAVAAGPGAPLGRFRRGDLIHDLLERLPELSVDDRADAARRMMSRHRDLDEDQRAEMIAAAFGVLDDTRFAPVFGPGSRAEVGLAGSAADLPLGVSVSGRIDRLVITPDRVLVVDYKTNRPAPARIEDADPAYVLQLAIYVAILRQLYPDRAVEAALVWTDGPRLMAVPSVMLDQALADAR